MDTRIRVLFCMEDLCFGGTQRQTLELVRRLDRKRFAPSFLVCTGKTDLDAVLQEENIPVSYLGRSRAVFPLFFLTMGPALIKSKPDLIVPCTALPNIWARIWGTMLQIPVIGTCRGGGGPKRQHERFLWRLTRHMICNAESLRIVLLGLGVPEDHLSYIPNGCNTEFFVPSTPPPSKRRPLLLCVARLCADKDHKTLFEAFARLSPLYPDLRLRLVGDGPDEARLKAWASEHPALPIEFVPGQTDVRPHYAEASLFVLSSDKEGQPNVLLEAMSSALPVCATRVGGIPALVQEGETGLLSPAKDSSALAENIHALLEDPKRADAMGARGREAVIREHSFATMVARHEELFCRFAKSAGRA